MLIYNDLDVKADIDHARAVNLDLYLDINLDIDLNTDIINM